MIVASFAILLGILALVGDAVLVITGMIERLADTEAELSARYNSIAIRTVWGIALVIASVFVLYGAVQMKRLKNYGTAKAAAIVSVVPCLGPCCFLGIPFGIWALVVLGKPEVKDAFQ